MSTGGQTMIRLNITIHISVDIPYNGIVCKNAFSGKNGTSI